MNKSISVAVLIFISTMLLMTSIIYAVNLSNLDCPFTDVTVSPLNINARCWATIWGDYDQDGDPDLFIAIDEASSKLFRNDEGAFVEVTPSVISDLRQAVGAAWGDFDHDGDLDLIVTQDHGGNYLFRNDGNDFFVDVTPPAISEDDNDFHLNWVDYNNDGHLDLYMVSSTSTNHLFQGDGSGNFVDVAVGLGVDDSGDGLGSAWVDFDNDGDQDFYLANNGANRLFQYNGSTFDDVTVSYQVEDNADSRGVAWGDYDNDGDFDLYVSNYGSANKLFRNDGAVFTEVGSGTPLADTGGGKSIAWFDYDNDGDLDIYLANSDGENKLFRNDGSGVFTDASCSPINGSGYSNAFGLADYDSDGDLDIYICNYSIGDCKLFRNDIGSLNNWKFVKLIADTTNSVGARIRLVTNGTSQIREITAGSGFRSQHSQVASFGLGSNALIDSLIVTWNSSMATVMLDESVNNTVTIEEVDDFTDVTVSPLDINARCHAVTWADYDQDGDPDLFVAVDNLGGTDPSRLLRNDNGSFVDVTPSVISALTQSVGAAWGDYDNDGDLDLVITQDESDANHLLRNDGNDTFTDVTPSVMATNHGDFHLSWIDYNEDGCLDLYMVSRESANRLLEGDSEGNFVDVASSLGVDDNLVGQSCAWVDFDNDGDQDFYLANNGANRLFQYNGSTFDDVTVSYQVEDDEDSKGVAWGDYDNDGDFDLYVCNFESANKLFRNDVDDSVFVEVAAGTDLADTSANKSAAWFDYDNDGDLDLYLTRTDGTNTLMENKGDGSFSNVTTSPLDDSGYSNSFGCADYDGDGDQDVYLANYSSNSCKLFRNNRSFKNRLSKQYNWMHFNIFDDDGTENRASLPGTRVEITTADGKKQIREITAGSGFKSQHDYIVEFGLGPQTEIQELKIIPVIPEASDTLLTYRMPPGLINSLIEMNLHPTYSDFDDGIISCKFELIGNYPNPFNPITKIKYEISEASKVNLRIYDVEGRLIKTLLDGRLVGTGIHTEYWNGTNENGSPVSSGVYFCRLKVKDESEVKKMILLK